MSKGKHCVFYHRYHIVWSTKYRYKVLRGAIGLRVRDIIRQVCAENGVEIIKEVSCPQTIFICLCLCRRSSLSVTS